MEKEKTFTIKILETEMATHDVKRFKCSKPSGFKFTPGQATDLTIKKPSLSNKKNPFTFTSLPEDNYLEFTIKMYPLREEGVTKHLKDIKKGDEFLIREPFGAIHYKGKGVFIAGGAGITPFISILRSLKKQKALKGNTLIFSNKTDKDIINEEEFDKMQALGLRKVYTVTRSPSLDPKIDNKRIDESYLKEKIKDFNQHFYVCGPATMVGELHSILKSLGAKAEEIVIET